MRAMFAWARRLLHRRRSLAWLLALLLWLPVAQWVAATHALVHLSASAGSHEPERATHLPASCEGCVVAAAIGGAAPQSAPVPILLPRLRHALPQRAPAAGVHVLFAAPYRSRAPPPLFA